MRKEACKIYDSLPSFDEAKDLGCNIVMESNGTGLWLKNTATGAIRQLRKDGLIYGFNKDDYNWDTIDKLENNGCAYSGEIRYGGIGRWDDFKDSYCGFTWTLHPDGRYYADEDGFGEEDDEEVRICVILNANLDIVVPWQPMDIRSVLKQLRREEFQTILCEVFSSCEHCVSVELMGEGDNIRVVIKDDNNREYTIFMLNNDIWLYHDDGRPMEERRDRMNMVRVEHGDSWEKIKARLNAPDPITHSELIEEFASRPDIQDSLKEYPEKVFWPKDMVCKHCGKRMVSLYYESPEWTWEEMCGRAGTLYICPYCKEDDHFDCEEMS